MGRRGLQKESTVFENVAVLLKKDAIVVVGLLSYQAIVVIPLDLHPTSRFLLPGYKRSGNQW